MTFNKIDLIAIFTLNIQTPYFSTIIVKKKRGGGGEGRPLLQTDMNLVPQCFNSFKNLGYY